MKQIDIYIVKSTIIKNLWLGRPSGVDLADFWDNGWEELQTSIRKKINDRTCECLEEICGEI